MKQELSAAVSFLLAGVLAGAGIAKLRRPALTRSAVQQFGLPSGLVRPLPFAEISAAALLVASPRFGGVLAFALLAVFTALVLRTLRAGRIVRCGCFGAADDRPIGPATVVRNVVLLAAAGTAALGRSDATLPSLPALVTAIALGCAASVVVALVGLRSETGALFPTVQNTRSTAS